MTARKTAAMLAGLVALAWLLRRCQRLLGDVSEALAWAGFDPTEEDEVEFILAMDRAR